jgi:proteasome assembly chaperone (PAC2) family protein
MSRSGLRYGGPVTALQYDRRPEGLRSPVVLSAFRGWNDAGQAASAALSFIGASLGAERFAVIDPEEFFDFQAHRPTIRLGSDPADRITWPEVVISEARAARAPRDLVLIAGTEPSMRWPTFCRLLLDVAAEVDATMLVSLGSLLADVPHTRPVTITGIASDPALIEGMGFREPTYEGPTGILGVLHAAAMMEGLPAVSLWAPVPHYVGVTPNPKGALALVRVFERVADVAIDAGDLEDAATVYEQQVSQAVARDPNASAFVERLEEVADEGGTDPATLPSGDVLAQDFMRFLNQRGEPEEDDEEE